MTQVKRVSLAEMLEETGTPALGYSKPQKNTIYIRDGMPKGLENEVMAHEYDHMSRGEEGPFDPISALAVGGSLVSGFLGAKGAKDAARASAEGSQAGIAENRRQFNLSLLSNLLLNAPAINTANTARSTLSGLLGLNVPGTQYRAKDIRGLV